MWDFNMGKALGAMIKTAPFVIFRVIVYIGIFIAYVLAVGVGAAIGYGIGSIGSEAGGFAFYGGLFGFGIVSAVLYWAREYLLYLVKAGHIAVLVEHFDGKKLPEGRGQIEHAHTVVKERFVETSVLFGVDRLIKGILRMMNRMIMSVATFLPIPGLREIAGFINKILTVSLTYTDEIILAYNIRTRSDNPWESSKDAIILYAQNYKMIAKNAVFLLLFMYVISFVIFLVFLGPAALLANLFPGTGTGVGVILAIIFALTLKAALLEPLSIAALMQVYFKAIEGQVPNPEWDQRLSTASKKFREMKDKAAAYVAPQKPAETPAIETPAAEAPDAPAPDAPAV